ncbi:MAG: ATP-binding protein [Lactobacillales bacterium]|jgi:predicted AAA+ superfamily ATPase|nr:ATP-binding protein [Lactobacillales bacterium]
MLIRKNYLDWLLKAKDNEFVKVITGVRRSGKSVILELYRKHLENSGVFKENIIFYNFEHPDNFRLTDERVLYEEIQAKVKDLNGKIYFIFDEIQEVKNWQKLINGLRVAFDSDIYITGSNANLLSGELATYLTGRYIELQVYPLSFAEFKVFNDSLNEKNPGMLFKEYLRWGGFPALPAIPDEKIKEDILDGIYTSIILKDVAARGEIREISLLDRVVVYLLDTIGSTVSIKKISDAIKAEGVKANPTSIDKYIELLKGSFVFYEAPRYDIRRKQRLKTLAKYYVVDTGIRNNILGRIGNTGSQLENIIYMELKRRNYEVFVGKFDSAEVDFVCFKNGEVDYFQVAYQLPRDSNREQKNLLNIADNYKKTIISLNRMDVGNIDGIPVVYAVDWLLGESV